MCKGGIERIAEEQYDTLYHIIWKEESRQTNAEMVRPRERGYGMIPEENRDGRSQAKLACHESSRHIIKGVIDLPLPEEQLALPVAE